MKRALLLKKNRLPGLVLPSSFSWTGIDQEGTALPDGSYFYHIEISYGSKQQYISPEYRVIIDNTAPVLEVSAAFPLFSPDGDGRLDTLRIFQRFSSIEERWDGRFLDGSGKEVRSFLWNELATDLVWDGRDSAGNYVPDGEYSYSVTSTDRAGNKSVFELNEITVNTEKASVSIRRDLESFSPNNDGKKDRLQLTVETASSSDLISWEVSVHNRKSEPVKTFTGQNSLPGVLIFEGKDNSGKILPDGFYKAHLSISYSNGSVQENVSQLFEIDTAIPLINISSPYLLFSARWRREKRQHHHKPEFQSRRIMDRNDNRQCRQYNTQGVMAGQGHTV